MGVSKIEGYPQIMNFNRFFHYKPSILGYHYFWKHPYIYTVYIYIYMQRIPECLRSKVFFFLVWCLPFQWSNIDFAKERCCGQTLPRVLWPRRGRFSLLTFFSPHWKEPFSGNGIFVNKDPAENLLVIVGKSSFFERKRLWWFTGSSP